LAEVPALHIVGLLSGTGKQISGGKVLSSPNAANHPAVRRPCLRLACAVTHLDESDTANWRIFYLAAGSKGRPKAKAVTATARKIASVFLATPCANSHDLIQDPAAYSLSQGTDPQSRARHLKTSGQVIFAVLICKICPMELTWLFPRSKRKFFAALKP